MAPMHIAILTGGGDCPGLNAVIRAATLELLHAGARVSGIERGFLGLMRGRLRPLAAADVDDILEQGGTILGTHNRADPFHDFARDGADVSAEVIACARAAGIDAVLAIGGDGTMDIAARLHALGLPMIGVPKTIDNDIALTERSFGFDSAVAIVAEAIGRLRTTARSHGRVMIVETMGRYAGWIALEGGIAGGADAILIPELPFEPQRLLDFCRRREAEAAPGRDGSTLICIAEGCAPAGGALTVARTVADSPTRCAWAAWASACARCWSRTCSPRCAPRCSGMCSAAAHPRLTTACLPRASATPRHAWRCRAGTA